MKVKRIPACHPERPHFAKGLCRPCYRHDYHLKHADATALWRKKNPQLAAAIIRRYNQKQTGKKIYRRRAAAVMTKSPARQAYIKSISHHLSKGRSIADIVCWMSLPYSVVQSVVQQIQNTK